MNTAVSLARNYYDVNGVVWADKTELADGLLRVNRDEIEALVKPTLAGVAQARLS